MSTNPTNNRVTWFVLSLLLTLLIYGLWQIFEPLSPDEKRYYSLLQHESSAQKIGEIWREVHVSKQQAFLDPDKHLVAACVRRISTSTTRPISGHIDYLKILSPPKILLEAPFKDLTLSGFDPCFSSLPLVSQTGTAEYLGLKRGDVLTVIGPVIQKNLQIKAAFAGTQRQWLRHFEERAESKNSVGICLIIVWLLAQLSIPFALQSWSQSNLNKESKAEFRPQT